MAISFIDPFELQKYAMVRHGGQVMRDAIGHLRLIRKVPAQPPVQVKEEHPVQAFERRFVEFDQADLGERGG
jgi:hypothetical protein